MAGKRDEIKRTGGNGRRSTCVAHGGLVYVSGITTVDIAADVRGQAQDVFSQMDRLLAANGASKDSVLSATVYLGTMADFGDFNAEWDLWVTDAYEPALSVVQAALPLPEYRVMVSLIAAQE
ncbi:RidA family protein [Ruminococcaceae bacterium OttesenSCG-928-O06]|nr:RidA family protein [Ruminococcaceae bacterium OttesenSCG-928-O06]